MTSQLLALNNKEFENYLKQVRLVAHLATMVDGLLWFSATLYLIYHPNIQSSGLWLGDTLLLGCTIVFIGATFATRIKRLQAAVMGLIVATDLTVITFGLGWGIGPSNASFALTGFSTFIIAIVITGLIGDQVMLFGTTWVMSLATVLLLGFAPTVRHIPPISNLEVAGLMLFEQWGIALLMRYAIVRNRHISSQLEDTSQAYQRSQQVEQLKDQFIANVNHELRTPVMAIHGFLEIYMLRPAMAAERREQLIKQAFAASHDLIDLLNSILDIQRLEPDIAHYQPQVVEVRPCLDKALALLDPRMGYGEGRDLHVTIPDGLTVMGDPLWIQLIFLNLLSNAAKYSSRGSPVEITTHIVYRERTIPNYFPWRDVSVSVPELVELTVRDWGFGIPPNEIPLLFQRFVRLPRDLTSTISGNGLGLYLCRSFVETMGGRIWVESTGCEGEGSLFHIQLPIPEASLTPESIPCRENKNALA
jgi:signal transduction histidine kinase